MKIEAYRQECVICATGLDDQPNEDGTVTAEFYPVDLLLTLRTSEKMLEGHPFLDMEPEEGDDKPTVAVENLRPGLANRIRREVGRGKLVALKIKRGRPPKSGKGRQWRRAQRYQPHKEREGRVGLLFVRGEDYLSKEDLHWIDAICVGGRLYYEQLQLELQAVQAIGEFVMKLRRVVVSGRKKKRVKVKKRLKRKERRRLEAVYD